MLCSHVAPLQAPLLLVAIHSRLLIFLAIFVPSFLLIVAWKSPATIISEFFFTITIWWWSCSIKLFFHFFLSKILHSVFALLSFSTPLQQWISSFIVFGLFRFFLVSVIIKISILLCKLTSAASLFHPFMIHVSQLNFQWGASIWYVNFHTGRHYCIWLFYPVLFVTHSLEVFDVLSC